MLALAIFAYVFQYYVFVLIGAHYIVMLILLLVQRTTFCADLERLPDGELKLTRRWPLEIPFNVIASFIYVFVYFNLKRGRTRIWAGIYHLLVLAENTTMAALIYVNSSSASALSLPFFPLITLTVVIGLYVAGIVFMCAFYLIYHPNKTECCFWVGLPKKCCPCCLSDEGPKEGGEGGGWRRRRGDLRSQVGNGAVVISEPTLVSHNGFVPRNLLPVGPRAAEAASANGGGIVGSGLTSDGVTATESAPRSQSLNVPKNRVSRDDRVSEMDTGLSASMSMSGSGARNAQEGAGGGRGGGGGQERGRGDSTSTVRASNLTSPVFTTPRSSRTQTLSSSNAARTPSESNNAFSDCLASELDTELSSNPMDAADTVIDSPLLESTLITSDHLRFSHKGQGSGNGVGRERGGKDVDSQRSCTDDTGIDVDSDNQLTQGTLGDMEEAGRGGGLGGGGLYEDGYEYGGETHLPVFTDAPVVNREHQYQSSLDSSRQQQYSSGDAESDQMLLPPPPQFQEQNNSHTHQNSTANRDSVTPTLPTPTYSPTELTPSSQRRELINRDVTPGTTSSGSQPSPERPRKTPRSPIGARTFQVSSADELDSGSSSKHVFVRNPRGGIAHGSSPQIISSDSHPMTPRSPKGARRLLVQQQQPCSSSSPRPLSTSVTADRSKDSPSRSPRRAPPPPPPPIPPKDSKSERFPQNGLTRGLTSLVVPPSGADRRAQSSSPMLKPHLQQGVKNEGITQANTNMVLAPSVDQINPRSPGKFPRGVSNYNRVVSVPNKTMNGHVHLNGDHHQQQRSSKSESWHGDRVLDRNHRRRDKGMLEMSDVPGTEGKSRPNLSYHSPSVPKSSNTSAFIQIPQDRNSSHLHEDLHSHSHSTPPREWHSPPRVVRSVSGGSYQGGPPHISKRSNTGNHNSRHLNSHQAHSPSYPRHPQGAMAVAGAPRMSRTPPRKRLVSMPTRVQGSGGTDSIDEPVPSLKSSSTAWSSSAGGSSSNQNQPHQPHRENVVSPEMYDKLEPEKIPEQQQQPPLPPARMHQGVSQPRPHSHHPTLYAPTSSAHESAV